MSEQEHEIRVHHYRRVDTRSNAKELVTEIVVAHSDTGRFLKKMEETRLTRPCYQVLDMRGKVLGECRPYVFNDRVHYLDDISYAMFQRGLEQNRGHYTVGTFEAIIFGAHTLHAMNAEREEEQQRTSDQARRQQGRERELRDTTGEADAQASTSITFYNPEIIPFGYYRQRQEGRLQYATAVQLLGKAGPVRATTRDISVGGVQLVVKGPCPYQPGEELQANFIGLQGQAAGAALKGVRYAIALLQRRELETTLCLRRLDRETPAGFTECIEELVERYQRKYKLDVEDDYLSAMSLFHERIYTESLVHIPFFVAEHGGQPRLAAVAQSNGNRPLMQFFSTDHKQYDFRCLQLPERLAALQEQGSLLLVLYRERGDDGHLQLHSATPAEFDSTGDFHRFLQHAMGFEEHMIVRVQVDNARAQRLDDRKVEYFLERLSYKSAEDALGLRNRLKVLLFTGLLVDVTRQWREALARYGEFLSAPPVQGLHAWVGGRHLNLETGDAGADILADVAYPELVHFGYVECRREDRYLVETAVSLAVGKQEFSGTTRDISTRGMCVRLAEPLTTEIGQELRVGLVNLQKKRTGTNLMDIPYRVIRSDTDRSLLMLERIVGRSQEGLSQFFVELIAKNQQKLGIDAGDIWTATAARIFEGLMTMNLGTLPFFIGRNEAGVTVAQAVAVPRGANRLARFFQAPDGEYEFYPIGDPRLVMALREAITGIRRQSGGKEDRAPHCELELYCYKEQEGDHGDWVLRWCSELELDSETAREAFIRKAMDHGEYCFLKVIGTFVQDLPTKQFDRLLEPVMGQSRHRGLKLSEQLRSVIGFGELVDITADMVLARSLTGPSV
ncbi:MAG TPA: PilZ domain-containing protein [Gammaproteobacteria bacterium]|nr:PilZ domain-containing protein [Gammaproteobacteria bacterium]